MQKPQIHESWYMLLRNEFEADYMRELRAFLVAEKKRETVFPPSDKIFAAFNSTPLNKVSIVILGQDPYHGDGQAHGLSFSVPDGFKQPPSLKNIFKELNQDLNVTMPTTGNLSHWAEQGVLLLNATLTVRAHQPGSHQKKGWEIFTDSVIQKLSENRENLVFMLWGNFARSKKVLIDEDKHLILEAPHPSPFSAYTGFFGCGHFSKANEYLKANAVRTIDWSLD